MGFPGGSVVKKMSTNGGDVGSIHGLKSSGGGNGILAWEIPYTEEPDDLWVTRILPMAKHTKSKELAFSSVHLLSHAWLFATPWITARQASLSITNSQSSLRLTSIESVMPSSHLILCHPLHLLPPIPPSISAFSNESTFHISWPKYWSFSFSISPSKQHPGLISFRMDWLDLLAVQGTLKSLLQHHREMQIKKYNVVTPHTCHSGYH